MSDEKNKIEPPSSGNRPVRKEPARSPKAALVWLIIMLIIGGLFLFKGFGSAQIRDISQSQFETIKMLCNRGDVDTIVNAGDSDREGEIIVRICVGKTGVSGKAFKRLWLPDQTEETISEGLKTMKDETEYEFLASEGYARTYIDWLYGVNLTRYASLKTGTLLRVGRVIVPIVKAIYDRDMAIKNFVPEIYYAPLSKCETKGEEIELLSKKKFSKDELAEGADYCNKLNSEKAIVTEKIDNLTAEGCVKINGQLWSARSEDDNVIIFKGDVVEIVAVKGVKLVCRK